MMPQEVVDILTSNIDTLWVIDCAILVFIMQAGFMCMETGLSRHKNSINVALKNAADFGLAVVIFWLFGFGLMFGKSFNGYFGTDLFFFKTDQAEYMTYFVFQAMFVATAATIVSGAVAGRMKLIPFFLFAVVLTAFIYPTQGYWNWGGGFLSTLGYSDYAGSGTVHLLGAAAALGVVTLLGPRNGKYASALQGFSGEFMELFAQKFDFNTVTQILERVDLSKSKGFEIFRSKEFRKRASGKTKGTFSIVLGTQEPGGSALRRSAPRGSRTVNCSCIFLRQSPPYASTTPPVTLLSRPRATRARTRRDGFNCLKKNNVYMVILRFGVG